VKNGKVSRKTNPSFESEFTRRDNAKQPDRKRIKSEKSCRTEKTLSYVTAPTRS